MKSLLLALLCLLVGTPAVAQLATPVLSVEKAGDCRSLSSRDPLLGTLQTMGCTDANGFHPRPSFVGPITASGPNGFWTNSNVVPGLTNALGQVHRITGRVQIGAATAESGDFYLGGAGATAKDWLEQFEAARSDARAFRTSQAQLAVGGTNGGIGGLFYVRTSDSNFNYAQLGQAVTGEAVNDNVALGTIGVSAGYFISFKTANVVSETQSFEIEAADEVGNSPEFGPYSTDHSGSVHGLLFGGGGGDSKAIGNPISFFTRTVNANATARAWQIVDSNSLLADGSGHMHWTELPTGAQLEWYAPTSAIGDPVSIIRSSTLTPTNRQLIDFRDDGIYIGSADGLHGSLSIAYTGTASTAKALITPATSGNPVQYTGTPITGTDADVGVAGAGNGAVTLTSTTAIKLNGPTQVPDGQKVCFAATNSCVYHSSGKLYYDVGGVHMFSVADTTGNVIFKGTVTQSGTP